MVLIKEEFVGAQGRIWEIACWLGRGWSGMWSCQVFDPIFGEIAISEYFTDVMFTAMKYGQEEQVMIIT